MTAKEILSTTLFHPTEIVSLTYAHRDDLTSSTTPQQNMKVLSNPLVLNVLLCAPALVAAARTGLQSRPYSAITLSAIQAPGSLQPTTHLDARMLSTSKKWIKKVKKALTPKKKATVAPRPRSRWGGYMDRFKSSRLGRETKLAQKVERDRLAAEEQRAAAMALAPPPFGIGAIHDLVELLNCIAFVDDFTALSSSMRLLHFCLAFIALLCTPALAAGAPTRPQFPPHSIGDLSAIGVERPSGSAMDLDARMLTPSKKWIKAVKKAIKPKKKKGGLPRQSAWQSYKERVDSSRLGRLVNPAKAAERDRAEQIKSDAAMDFIRMHSPYGAF
ncbi:hypothetical protein BCV69DRAFT_298678 [Microstroma glucosiphilum]|uniref:Uncharacterized protein n=1 Tax=Pseudomicrostroma glucosiphilum TaxID=1684307 RepID=A0A316U6I5_9BASI|nr:hypothetical protein BCV69DRAFT_298678 [Pseudomicrostroma glucosiphilum]PWN20877.1 hypothetical protein BCV69DRAFT_298678 [Pseudomicrostroma glucosiphilum]